MPHFLPLIKGRYTFILSAPASIRASFTGEDGLDWPLHTAIENSKKSKENIGFIIDALANGNKFL
jgi:hypothetical protein